MISGGSWGNLGPTRPSSHVSSQACRIWLSHGQDEPHQACSQAGSPHHGCHSRFLAPSLQKQDIFFLLFPPHPPGWLHKHSVARQPSSLLSSWIPGNSVQANSQECTYSWCCLWSQFSSLAPGFSTRNPPGICLILTFTLAVKSPSFCRLCIQND